MPWLVCVTLNVQYQFKEFWRTQIWVKFCIYLFFLVGFLEYLLICNDLMKTKNLNV
jgi:formate/nitrite transporter FocA (FNT family)